MYFDLIFEQSEFQQSNLTFLLFRFSDPTGQNRPIKKQSDIMMSSPPITADVIINIPRICKILYMKVNNNEQIYDLIYRIVNSTGLKETNLYRLYGLSDHLVQIPSEDHCSTLIFNAYDHLYLLTKDPRCITVYFEDRCSKIAFDRETESSAFVSMAVRCLGLQLDDHMYVLYDPLRNCICPIDIPVQSNILVLRQLSTLLFNLSDFNVDPTSITLNASFLGKKLVAPIVKKLLLKVKYDAENKNNTSVKLCKLDQNRIGPVWNNLNDPDGIIDSFSHEEILSFLFFLLSFNDKVYFTNELHQLIVSVMASSKRDMDKYEFVYGCLFLMPLFTYSLLDRLSKSFLLYIPNKTLYGLLARIFFPNSINREAEELFISYILVFQKTLLQMNNQYQDTSKNIKIYNDHLYLFNEATPDILINAHGEANDIQYRNKLEDETAPKSSIIINDISELADFNAKLDIYTIMESIASYRKVIKEEIHDTQKFQKLNKLIGKVMNLNNEKNVLIQKIQKRLNQMD